MSESYGRLDKVVAPVKNAFSAIAGATLVIMMVMTALDVGLRYLLNRPIPGGLELVEYMMSVVVPFSLVVTAYNRAHIEVDLLFERFSKALQRIVGTFTDLISTVFFALITWQGYFYISEQYRSGLTSSVLFIPHYPFIASLTAAFAVLTVITALQTIHRATGRKM